MPTEADPIFAAELTKDEYAHHAAERTFVLPVGILEEHGPHLPLGTDTFQVEAVVNEAAEDAGAVVLPTMNYGNCHSTQPFPGSISLPFDTVRTLAEEILTELARHEVTSVAIVSGHAGGGHMRALKQAARNVLADNSSMRIALLSEWDVLFGLAGETLNGETVPEADGHAGTMETARIQHLRPDLVDEAPPGEHLPEEDEFLLSAQPDEGMPDGYIGDPSKATPELGEGLHDAAVDRLTELFTDIAPEPEPGL
jgi:creatinine amidohydrolase